MATGVRVHIGSDLMTRLLGGQSVKSDETQVRLHSARIREGSGAAAFPFSKGESRIAEQYRIVRTRILHDARRPRVLAVSSVQTGDGKSVNAVNIAGTLALRAQNSVLLVDADFRRPSLAAMLGVAESPGLGDLLDDSKSVDETLVRLEPFSNFWFLPCGRPHKNPTDSLDSDDWTSLSAVLRNRFSFVVVDTPPIGPVADFELIERACDGIVMVVRPDHTDRKLCLDALQALPAGKLIGVVLNCVDDWFLWKSHSYYYYYSNECR